MTTASGNGRTRRLIGFSVLVFLVSTEILFGSQKENEPTRETITLRLRDGRTGFPIWAEDPNIWVGHLEGVNPRTNWKGEIVVDVTGAVPRELRFSPNWYADCRYQGDIHTGYEVKYSLAEIMAKGVVAGNVCGKRQA